MFLFTPLLHLIGHRFVTSLSPCQHLWVYSSWLFACPRMSDLLLKRIRHKWMVLVRNNYTMLLANEALYSCARFSYVWNIETERKIDSDVGSVRKVNASSNNLLYHVETHILENCSFSLTIENCSCSRRTAVLTTSAPAVTAILDGLNWRLQGSSAGRVRTVMQIAFIDRACGWADKLTSTIQTGEIAAGSTAADTPPTGTGNTNDTYFRKLRINVCSRAGKGRMLFGQGCTYLHSQNREIQETNATSWDTTFRMPLKTQYVPP
jgi:hypothetical protein